MSGLIVRSLGRIGSTLAGALTGRAVTLVPKTGTLGTGNAQINYSTTHAGISITHAAASTTVATTVVSVVDRTILITPGCSLFITITGGPYTWPPGLLYTGINSGKPYFTSHGNSSLGFGPAPAATVAYYDGSAWQVRGYDGSTTNVFAATKTSAAASPIGLTSWTYNIGSGPITVSGTVSRSALDVSIAVNDSQTLVTASIPGTGALVTVEGYIILT